MHSTLQPTYLSSAESGTQNDLITVHRTTPEVKYLEGEECVLEESTTPKCYHLGPHQDYVRLPKIPVAIEGVCVPIILDTGAEVSLITTKFLQSLFPDRDLGTTSCSVRNLGGNTVVIRGLIEVEVEVCNVTLKHPFYFYDHPIFLLSLISSHVQLSPLM